MDENEKNEAIEFVRKGKRDQVRDLFNEKMFSVFKGSLPANVIESFVNSVDEIYYGE